MAHRRPNMKGRAPHHLEVAAARAAAGKISAPRYFTTSGLATLLGLKGLEGPPAVRLLSARYLIAAAKAGSPLPRRQELEVTCPHAYCSVGMLKQCLEEVGVVADRQPKDARFPGIVVVSYCWHGTQHPDPDAALLNQLAPILTWYTAERAKRNGRTATLCEAGAARWEARGVAAKAEPPRGAASKWKCRDADFAVFVDYWSLFQGHDPKAPPHCAGPRRTSIEQEAFEFALAEMDLFYAHAGTTVVRLSQEPAAWKGRGKRRVYEDRGWCNFELYASMLVKNWAGTLDSREWVLPDGEHDLIAVSLPSAVGNAALAAAVGRYDPVRHRDGGGGDWRGPCGVLSTLLPAGSRVAPMHPDTFDELIAHKQFSVAGDHSRVAKLYRQVATAVLASAGEWLSFEDKVWGAHDFEQTAQTLALCKNLVGFLGLGNTGMDDEGAAAFCEALSRTTLPKLEMLSISNNPLGDGAARSFAAALQAGKLPSLKRLYFKYRVETISEGAEAELDLACTARGIEPL
eukprot:m.13452 g.13452  ORF g.13452 m.13452 type:complete len:516 (+) comp8130_c0_seq1:328-1875(+)